MRSRWQYDKVDNVVALGVCWFEEGSISPWKRQWHKKSLVRSSTDNPHCSILFWTSPYLLWKPRGKVNLPFDSYSCQLQTQMGHLTNVSPCTIERKLCEGTLWHEQLCLHTAWRSPCESVTFNVLGLKC